jgi:hypothetical protein
MPTAPRPIPFPLKGLNQTADYEDQPEGTSPDLLNVRPFDATEKRLRGGRRPGLSKWLDDPVLIGLPIQTMVVATESVPYQPESESYENDYVFCTDDSDPGETFVLDYDDGTLVTTINGGDAPIFVQGNEEGYLYIGGGRLRGWNSDTTNIGLTDTMIKVLGKAPWTVVGSWDIGVFLTGSSEYALYPESSMAFDPIYKRLGVGNPRTRNWPGSDSEFAVLVVFDDATGEVLWTFDAGTKADDTPNYEHTSLAVDALGNWFLGYISTSSYGGTSGPQASIWKISPAGLVLATFDTGERVTGIDVNENGEVIASTYKRSTSFTGYDATAANIFILDNNLNLLSIDDVHSASSGTSYRVDVQWVGTTKFAVRGQRINGPDFTVRLVTRATGADDWTYDTGVSQSAEKVLAISRDGDILCSSSSGAIRLAQSDGSVEWSGVGDQFGLFHSYELGTIDTTLPAQPRETTLVTVAGGSIFTIKDGVVSSPTGSLGALTDEAERVVRVAAYSNVYFVDGTNSKVLDLVADTVSTWVATAGTLPSNARLIALYRGRIVLSGVSSDPNNWFMSKQGDPDDWDYAPATPSPQDAVAGNNSDAGKVGDIVTALMPFSDDLMWMGCNRSIWQMSGDPLAGGEIDLVSGEMGMSFGSSWAVDPQNACYFHGHDGIYQIFPGGQPTSITSGRLDRVFRDLDRSSFRVKLTWNHLEQELWVVISPLDRASETSVYVWDKRTDSWWKDSYPTSMGPEYLLSYDASAGSDEAFLFGCRDGYIRKQDSAALGDDGTAITSRVRLEPLVSAESTRMVRMSNAAFRLTEDSGAVAARFYGEQTAEQLADSTSVRYRRNLTAGFNGDFNVRMEAGAVGIELYADELAAPWAVSEVTVTTGLGGRVRRRRR